MPDFKIKIHPHDHQPDIMVVALYGDLDTATVDDFDLTLGDILDTGAQRILLDLHGLQLINSSGIAAVIRAAELSQRNGGELKICRANAEVLKMFDVLGLTMFVTNMESIEEAPQHFSGGSPQQ